MKVLKIKVLKIVFDFLLETYKAVDRLRADDTPAQVMALWLAFIALALGMGWLVTHVFR
jgi:hypothetical protein